MIKLFQDFISSLIILHLLQEITAKLYEDFPLTKSNVYKL